ncbi:MAG: NAD-dependent epimerase/dehydratase family protein [Cellulomonas sp.]
MARGQVRSGRREAQDASTALPGSADTREVVVVGPGSVAAGIGAWFSVDGERPVRVLDDLPPDSPEAALADVGSLVVVPHRGDLAASWALPADRRRAEVVERVQRALAAARTAGVPHVVVVTSAMVHGAAPDRSVITDDAPVMSPAGGIPEGVVGDLLAVEQLLARFARRGRPRVTVLRPAALVGPGIDTIMTRHFEAPRLLAVRGIARDWQFVHVDDLAAAVALVLDADLVGPFTVGVPGPMSAHDVETAAGLRRIELAAATAFGTAERLHRVGALPAPSSELAYAVYPWTVEAGGLLAAGWEPQRSSSECLDVLLEGVQGRITLAGRRVGARDAAALGAAGAAVALIGTAALWRRARTSRRG